MRIDKNSPLFELLVEMRSDDDFIKNVINDTQRRLLNYVRENLRYRANQKKLLNEIRNLWISHKKLSDAVNVSQSYNRHVISSKSLIHLLDREKRSNGIFTVKSKLTGNEFTFKIVRKEFRKKWYTHVKVENQYLQFEYLGSFQNGHVQRRGVKNESQSSIAISYILRKVVEGKTELLDSQIELMHMGKCIVCNKPLTDSNSIELGVGPICRS